MIIGERDIIILGALVGNELLSDTEENDWIKVDMAETGKLQILKTNWNQAQTFADAKLLCDSKGGIALIYTYFAIEAKHIIHSIFRPDPGPKNVRR